MSLVMTTVGKVVVPDEDVGLVTKCLMGQKDSFSLCETVRSIADDDQSLR